MTWAKFYHWLTTSRYTRRLESEIEQLRSDNDHLRSDNDGLLRALYPAIRTIRAEHEAVKEIPKTAVKTFRW